MTGRKPVCRLKPEVNPMKKAAGPIEFFLVSALSFHGSRAH
jgi:hypothetical protein